MGRARGSDCAIQPAPKPGPTGGLALASELRAPFLQFSYSRSHPGSEDNLFEISSLRRSAGPHLRAPIPGETTIFNFRQLLELVMQARATPARAKLPGAKSRTGASCTSCPQFVPDTAGRMICWLVPDFGMRPSRAETGSASTNPRCRHRHPFAVHLLPSHTGPPCGVAAILILHSKGVRGGSFLLLLSQDLLHPALYILGCFSSCYFFRNCP